MITKEIYDEYLENLISGNRPRCREIVENLMAEEVDIKDLYINLFQTSMYQVGEMWESNQISVATEHLATSITESLMALIYPNIFSKEHIGKKAIISCIANEYHQIGARMVADIFEINGWDGYFLGANTPIKDLINYIDSKNPDIVCFSLSVYFNISELMLTLETVKSRWPKLTVLLGGQAFRWGGKELAEKYPKVFYIDSLNKLENFIKEMS
ncbi:MAG: B12 binding domain protein [Candidatus Methanofastidiosum methylothiophilum]|uniref:B12 binding domain protein n=1 Tax=Candidatus Methanofastidiosum methylothiophilum TaxID=1705564 RepID=A0A150J5L4_9EURY|nr:MAG: B12 binding domain protein [Candidatus Methanofastidiosum methylthiophilus]NMC76292.1 cobalamin-binding protein [Candidatus Methanofastidiosa archaeon]